MIAPAVAESRAEERTAGRPVWQPELRPRNAAPVSPVAKRVLGVTLALPLSIQQLRLLLRAQSRIESRILILQWGVMILVAAGVLLPHSLGSQLNLATTVGVLVLLALHPVAYLASATFAFRVLSRNGSARVAVLTAIDVVVAVGVLFGTATKPGYTQVLLFCVVLLAATRYSLSRALGITSLLAVLQFFSIVAGAPHSLQITNLTSAIVAMYAMMYGVSQLSRSERTEAAIAAENSRLYHAVLLRNRELATINALSQSVTQDTDPDRLLESGLELILASLPVTWGQAFRYDRDEDSVELLFVRRSDRVAPAPAERAAALEEAHAAARTRRAISGQTVLVGREPMLRLSVPIMVQGLARGVLQSLAPLVASEQQTEAPAQSLSIVCQELGTAVEKALLRLAAQRSLVLEEKNRIARELHDTVLQMLFTSGLNAEWCLQRLPEGSPLAPKLSEVRRLSAQAGGELRSAIFTLSSRVAEVGLLPALESLTATFSDQYDLPISFSAIGQPPAELSVLAQNALHRVVRESLMNTYKHARASHVAVRVIFERSTMAVVVQDDGVGIADETLERFADDHGHFGLRTLATQIESLRGRFVIQRGEEGGTMVRAVLPASAGREEVLGLAGAY